MHKRIIQALILFALIISSPFRLQAETVFLHSKSTTSVVNSYESGGHDKSSSNSTLNIDSREQSGFVYGSEAYGRNSNSFQGTSSEAFKKDAAFKLKGVSSSSSSQESSKVTGR